MSKVYFAKFINKHPGKEFYKIGHTRYSDAARRFDRPGYENWEIRILASTYTGEDVLGAIALEEVLKHLYPKNLWVEEKFSGVTEIVALTDTQAQRIIDALKNANKIVRIKEKEFDQNSS